MGFSAFSVVFNTWKALSVGLRSGDWLGHWKCSCYVRISKRQTHWKKHISLKILRTQQARILLGILTQTFLELTQVGCTKFQGFIIKSYMKSFRRVSFSKVSLLYSRADSTHWSVEFLQNSTIPILQLAQLSSQFSPDGPGWDLWQDVEDTG